MSFQEDLVDLARTEYSSLLTEHGFKLPVVREKGYSTRVFFLQKEFAVELEFEWRDFCVFLSIVRLAKGKLPKGYYLDPAKRTQIPLILLIEERNWQVNKDLIEEIIKIGHKKRVDLAPEDLKAQLLLYHALLRSCITKVVEGGITLFE